MILAAFSLAVPGWALAQGVDAARVPTQSVVLPQALVLPQGQELSEEELDNTEGTGFLTAAGGFLMMASGMKQMVEGARRGDWIDFALGAGGYLIGKATLMFGVVTGPATP